MGLDNRKKQGCFYSWEYNYCQYTSKGTAFLPQGLTSDQRIGPQGGAHRYNFLLSKYPSPPDLRQPLVNRTPRKIFVYKILSRKWPTSETNSPFSLLPNGVLLRLLRLNKVILSVLHLAVSAI